MRSTTIKYAVALSVILASFMVERSASACGWWRTDYVPNDNGVYAAGPEDAFGISFESRQYFKIDTTWCFDSYIRLKNRTDLTSGGYYAAFVRSALQLAFGVEPSASAVHGYTATGLGWGTLFTFITCTAPHPSDFGIAPTAWCSWAAGKSQAQLDAAMWDLLTGKVPDACGYHTDTDEHPYGTGPANPMSVVFDPIDAPVGEENIINHVLGITLNDHIFFHQVWYHFLDGNMNGQQNVYLPRYHAVNDYVQYGRVNTCWTEDFAANDPYLYRKAQDTANLSFDAFVGTLAPMLPKCGDLNGDGVFDAADRQIAQHELGCSPGALPSNVCGTGNVQDCGDVDNNCHVNSTDYHRIVNGQLACSTDYLLRTLCVIPDTAGKVVGDWYAGPNPGQPGWNDVYGFVSQFKM